MKLNRNKSAQYGQDSKFKSSRSQIEDDDLRGSEQMGFGFDYAGSIVHCIRLKSMRNEHVFVV